jgi:ISXO2-like transposase domain
MRRANHMVAFVDEDACTGRAESCFARLRRAEWGQHHHTSGRHLGAFAREVAWREDTRRRPNGALHALMAAAALDHPVSRTWAGYWQRER